MSESFAKIKRTLWDGTLGPFWEAWSLFTFLLAHSDAGGIVDMTPAAISARSGMPMDAVLKGIEILESPDPESRTPGEDGRRIVRLASHRTWGWRIVNHAKHRRASDAERAQTYRARHGASRAVTAHHHAEAEAEADIREQKDWALSAPPPKPPTPFHEFALPTVARGEWFWLLSGEVNRLGELFLAVNVRQEIRNMIAWLIANPARRKTKRGMMAFVNRWLAGEQDKARIVAPGSVGAVTAPVMRANVPGDPRDAEKSNAARDRLKEIRERAASEVPDDGGAVAGASEFERRVREVAKAREMGK